MKTLTVIAPVYNEEEVIADFYRELTQELKKITDYHSTIIFAVDRCSDNTLAILKKIALEDKAVRVLGLSSHFKHQMQLLAGIDHADSDAVVMMDSDLQHPPSVIPKLLAEYEKGNDVVYTIREQVMSQSFYRKWSSDIFYWFLNRISDVPISSNAADFRLISRRVAKLVKEEIRERNLFLRGIFPWVGFNQTVVRFVANPRRAGKSKYSLKKLVAFGLSGIISFSKKPLRVAIITGLIFASFGFLYAVVIFFQYYFGGSYLPPGWATLIVLLSVFSGVQLICLGIIGEYIGAIFDEVKKRPHYIIEEKINF